MSREPRDAQSDLVRLTAEVSGSIDQVWEAIATGPGLSRWFYPSEFLCGFDGRPHQLTVYHGPHLTRSAEVEEWEPPYRYRVVGQELFPGGGPVGTTWSLESLGIGCRLTVEHRLASPHSTGVASPCLTLEWQLHLAVLRLYLAHFESRWGHAGGVVMISTPETAERAWERMLEPLGLSGRTVGEPFRAEPDAPELAGRIGWLGPKERPFQAVLRLDQPGPGLAVLQVGRLHGATIPSLRLSFYGEPAARLLTRHEPRWQRWLGRLFPAGGAGTLPEA